VLKEKIKIKNRLGIHARPASMLAQEAGKYKSYIAIAKDGTEINAKSIMGIMMLAAECGSVITLSVSGADESEAFASIKNTFKRIFEEDDNP
jgi:phosphocarrier protein